MENIVYRVPLDEKGKNLEFYIVRTNDINPHKELRELGVVMYGDNTPQIDAALELAEIDSLLKYLNECREYIKEFNKEM